MTSYAKVLVVVGGAAVIVSLTIAVIFVEADLAGASLRTDVETTFTLQRLGDELLTEVSGQREAIVEYLMSADARPLARYRQSLKDEIRTTDQIRAGTGSLTGVTDALAVIAAESAIWQASVADPAIAAVQSGSVEAIRAAKQTVLQDEAATQAATSQFRLRLDAMATDLRIRSDALNGLRVAATAFGVAIELLAACISLWFVRRYGLKIGRDTRRRAEASAERIAIIASLRTLRTQRTPEATAALIAESLRRLPGVNVAEVFERTDVGLLALAIVGLPGFPIRTGQALPESRARHLMDRSDGGPWAEHWIQPSEPDANDERLTALGIRSRAFAPIRADGELIGLIGVHTTDLDHAKHMVEDLPAVGEFASVAETILAPALVARRDRAATRRQIGATIASAAFRSVFQPIVDLATGTTVGFEALTRFENWSPPDLMFAAARACGMGIELQTVTLEAALRDARHLAPGGWLSLNVSPALLAQRGILVPMLAGRSEPVVLEVTEHEVVEAYAPLREAMLRLGPGVRLAVDDVGAGIANFNHLVELRPDFIKIDVGLVRGVEADPGRRAVVMGLVHFAAEVGCKVIAEGIETEAERATVTKLGVTLGQGYLLGKPAPADAWSHPTPSHGTPVTGFSPVVRPSGRLGSPVSRRIVATPPVRPR
jgi:EAL domain-containing protein (putative c-di-GMP-specific phosphodiesterase class I)